MAKTRKRSILTRLLSAVTAIGSAVAMLPAIPNLSAAAAEYDLWICGTRVTSSNARDILGEGKTVFTYDAYTKTLTVWTNEYYSTAVCESEDDPVIESKISGLTINVTGESRLKTESDDCLVLSGLTTITGEPLTICAEGTNHNGIYAEMALIIRDTNITVDGSGSAICGIGANGFSIENSNINATGTKGAIRNFGSIALSNGVIGDPEGAYVSGGQIADRNGSVANAVRIGRTYDLWVDGTKVSDLNKENILQNGVFEYLNSTNTLCVNGNYTTANTVILNGIDNLRICFNGNSTLTSTEQDCIFSYADGLIVSGGGIYRNTFYHKEVLNAKRFGIYANNGTLKINDAWMDIQSSYGITGAPNNENLYIFRSNLHVTATKGAIRDFANGIELSNCYIESPHFTTIENGSICSSGTFATDVQIKEGNPYNLYVAGQRVTDLNQSDILGDGIFSYNPASKTLTVKGSGSCTGTPFIDNGIKGLTLKVDRDATLTSTDKDGISTYGSSMKITGNGKLKINAKTDGIYTPGGYLTFENANVDISAQNGIIGWPDSDGVKVKNSNLHIKATSAAMQKLQWGLTLENAKITSPAGAYYNEQSDMLTDTSGACVKEVIITPGDLIYYDLYIAGTQVNDVNASDILGDGKYSFDAETNTLNLKGNYFSTSEEDFICNQINGLTINVVSDSVIETVGSCISSNGYNLTITGSGKLTLDSTMRDRTAVYFSDATLTIKDADVDINGGDGIIGDDIREKLIINNSKLHVVGRGYAIEGLYYGIELENCYIDSPRNAYWDSVYDILRNADGSAAASVTIKPGTLQAVDLSKVKILVTDRPYPGNITDKNVNYATGQGYTINQNYSGWFDVANDRFLSNTDRLQFDTAYLYRVRLVPDSGVYFEEATAAALATVKFVDSSDNSMQYLECVAAHLNSNGTLDLYAGLHKNWNSYAMTGDFSTAAAYNMPEGAVCVNGDTAYNASLNALAVNKLLPFSAFTVKETSILCKMRGLNYQYIFPEISYEISIDGTNYVSAATMIGKSFEGLTPDTDYTVYARLAGETEPFFTRTLRTAAPEVTLAITKQPVDASGCIGDKVQFTVEAEGNGLIYQWQYYNTETKKWENTGLAGNKTPTLTVSVLANRNGMKYHCIVKDTNGTKLTSTAATLKVNPKITAQPVDASGCIGDKVQFSVEATGVGLIYQWQYYNTDTKKWENTGLTGNKTPTLTVSVLANRNGMKYHCIVKDTNGTKLTSTAATLKVNPKITAQPVNASGCIGDKVQFTVEATGVGLIYQWQYYNTDTKKWENTGLAGNKTKTLTVTVTSARNGMKYHCIVKDSAGTKLTSTAATLKVLPKIVTQPQSVSAAAGSTAKFTVEATGIGLVYQWQYYNTSTKKWENTGLAGNKTATLSVTAISSRNGIKYHCIVKDSAGNKLTSTAATLTVE